jgi:RHS repeat-associated protein
MSVKKPSPGFFAQSGDRAFVLWFATADRIKEKSLLAMKPSSGRPVHMNGRAYDPMLGRFLSVDPIIQFPANSQSLNPYSYILNNPLSGTDPTGYCSESQSGTNIRDFSGCRADKAQLSLTAVMSDGSRQNLGTFNSGSSADMARAGATAIPGINNGAGGRLSSLGTNRADGQQAGATAPHTLGQNDRPTQWMQPADWKTNVSDVLARDSEGVNGETAEFALGLTGVGGTAISLYELWYGESPISGHQASRLLAVIGVIPFARNFLKIGSAPRKTMTGGGASLENLSASEIQRIQNAANRSGQEINLVGSRAGGTAGSSSDWDYVIDANAKTRNSLSRSLPGAGDTVEGIRPNIDVFKGQVDETRPFIRFFPEENW